MVPSGVRKVQRSELPALRRGKLMRAAAQVSRVRLSAVTMRETDS